MTDPLIGRVLKDTYRIERLLTDGGMSRIYLVEQISLGRKAVVKMLLPSFHDEDFIQLFLREARVSSQLNHPNIVSVFDFGNTEDGLVYLVIEYLEGASLADIVAREKGLTLANIVWLMEPLCNAIRAAHQHNVVHRDLKPGNVMIARLSSNDNTVKVVDFGISKPMDEENLKHTQLGTVMGTPGYLAPEQIRGSNINHLADIYGIGAILHFMITGEAPYRGASREIIMNRQMKELPPPLSSYNLRDPACRILQPVIYKAMAIEREQRYPTIQALWQDFQVCARQNANLATGNHGSPLANASKNCQFVFQGRLQDGTDPARARQCLQAAFKFSEQQLTSLFSGKRVVVRKKIARADAERFAELFLKCGAIGAVEEMDDSTHIVTNPNSLPDPGVAEPISVAGFIDAGKTPYALDPQSQPGMLQRAVSQPTPAPASVPPAIATTSASTRNKRRLAVTFAALLALGITLYAAPSWRYRILDTFMYSTGLAHHQRGIGVDRIRLGMSAAFSGSAQALGQSMRVGMETYFKYRNDRGGINGRKLELYALDDGYNPPQAKQNLTRLLNPNDGAFVLIGDVGTPTTKAILPDILNNKILLFGALSGAQILRNNPPDRYVFNYRASYAEETAALVHYYVKVLGMDPRNIAVFYQNDSYGRDGLSGVANALARYNVSIKELSTATYQRNSAEVGAAIDTFKPLIDTIQGVIIIGTYEASAEFTRRMQALGYQGKFANVSFVGSEALAQQLRELDGWKGEGVIVSQVVPMYDAYATGVLEYRKALQQYFPNEAPDFVSLEGYIVAKLFCNALQRAGRYPTVESLIAQLHKMRDINLGIGKPLTFSESDHQASHKVWGSVLDKDGKFKALDFEKIQLD